MRRIVISAPGVSESTFHTEASSPWQGLVKVLGYLVESEQLKVTDLKNVEVRSLGTDNMSKNFDNVVPPVDRELQDALNRN